MIQKSPSFMDVYIGKSLISVINCPAMESSDLQSHDLLTTSPQRSRGRREPSPARFPGRLRAGPPKRPKPRCKKSDDGVPPTGRPTHHGSRKGVDDLENHRKTHDLMAMSDD